MIKVGFVRFWVLAGLVLSTPLVGYANPYFDAVKEMVKKNGTGAIDQAEIWLEFGASIKKNQLALDDILSWSVRTPRFSLRLIQDSGIEKIESIEVAEDGKDAISLRLVFNDHSSLPVRFFLPSDFRRKQISAIQEREPNKRVELFFKSFGKFYVESVPGQSLVVYDLDQTQERLTFIGINPKKNCEVCDTPLEKPLRCGTCKSVYYCNVNCQKQDWRGKHRLVCSQVGEAPLLCSIDGKWRLISAWVGELDVMTEMLSKSPRVVYHFYENGKKAKLEWVHSDTDGFLEKIYSSMFLDIDLAIREAQGEGTFSSKPTSELTNSVKTSLWFDDSETQRNFEAVLQGPLGDLSKANRITRNFLPLVGPFDGTAHLDRDRLMIKGKSPLGALRFVLQRMD